MHAIVKQWRRLRARRNPFVEPHRELALTIGSHPFLYSYHGWSITAGQNPSTGLWEAELERTDSAASEKTMPFELANDVWVFKASTRGEVLKLAKYTADLGDFVSRMHSGKSPPGTIGMFPMTFWYLFQAIQSVAGDAHYDLEVEEGVGTPLTREHLARAWKMQGPPDKRDDFDQLPLDMRLRLLDRAVEMENMRKNVGDFRAFWKKRPSKKTSKKRQAKKIRTVLP